MMSPDRALLQMHCNLLLLALVRFWENRALGRRVAAEVSADSVVEHAREAAHHARLVRPDLQAAA